VKIISVTAAAIALAGCAAAPEAPPASQSAAGSSLARPETVSEDVQVAAVIELQPRFDLQPEEPVCQRTMVTGSRISRVRCSVPLTETEQLLNDEITRAEFEHVRQMALIQEQRRAEQAAAEMMRRQMQTSGPR